jgi:hypothetical protein
MKKWLTFEETILDPPRKTKRWRVYCNADYLGDIKYHNAWRQYVFAPMHYTIFHNDCLAEIVEFLNLEKAKRKEECKKRKHT